jgi:hypothetical protein
MKFSQPVNVQLMSRRSFRQPDALFEFMRFFEEALPHLQPSVFNWTDPVNKRWNLSDMPSYIPPDTDGDADTIYWRRNENPKATGYFEVARRVNVSPFGRWHAGLSFVVGLADLNVDTLIEYIKSSTLNFDGDLAQIHWVCPQEEYIREAEYDFDVAGANGGSEFGTSSLMHWLPALPWAVVFGTAYVRMFGMDRLMSSPAHCVARLSDDAVYMQLSKNIHDLETNYQAVHTVRQDVQRHLGDEAFFDVKRAYHLRAGLGDIPMAQMVKAIADFRCPPPGTNGFRVPEFHFLPD